MNTPSSPLGADGPRFLGELDRIVDGSAEHAQAVDAARRLGEQFGKAYPADQVRPVRERLRLLSRQLKAPLVSSPAAVRRDSRQKAVIDAALEGLGPEGAFRNQLDVQPPRA